MAELNDRDEYTDRLSAQLDRAKTIIYELVNALATVRQDLEPLLSDEIERGNCSAKRIEPGTRKTTLADARKIARRIAAKVNSATQESRLDLNKKVTE